MKQLKFSEPLPKLILRKEKDTTWRINDSKNLTVSDKLSLCSVDGKEFAQAEILWVKETLFAHLTYEDIEGHESFTSDEEMFATYKGYYKMEVTSQTPLKVVKFRLL